MRNVHIDYHGPDHGFQAASLLAKDVAKENQMQEPTIISWHRDRRLGGTPAYYDGANPETWWEKYGEGNGGGSLQGAWPPRQSFRSERSSSGPSRPSLPRSLPPIPWSGRPGRTGRPPRSPSCSSRTAAG